MKMNYSSLITIGLCLIAAVVLFVTGHQSEGQVLLGVVVGTLLPQPAKKEDTANEKTDKTSDFSGDSESK